MGWYEVAHVIANKHKWETNYVEPLAYSIAGVVLIVPVGILLGHLIPAFSMVISTGGFMSKAHAHRLAVLVELHLEGKDDAARLLQDNVNSVDKMVKELEKEHKL